MKPQDGLVHQTPRMNNDRYLKTYEFTCADEETLSAWVAAIRTALGQPYYANSIADGSGDIENGVDDRVSINGIKPRRILIFVNPFGGTGAAKKVWKLVRPMFLVANINVHLVGMSYALNQNRVTILTITLNRNNACWPCGRGCRFC